MRPQTEIINILGVNIHTLSVNETIDFIASAILTKQKVIIAYVNVHALNLAYKQPQFLRFLNEADIVFCDGVGIKFGAHLLGLDVPDRFTPPDWIPQLSKTCIDHNLSMFFLGAKPGIAEKAAKKLLNKFPDLNIVGTYHGYFDKTPESIDNQEVIKKINAVKPDILILGFGMPLQEFWLIDNWSKLEATVAFPAGALFDYLAEDIYRAPKWITDNGFEWLARLIIEPRRLWKRYIIGNPLFLYRVLKQKVSNQ